MQKNQKVIYHNFIIWIYKMITLRKKILGMIVGRSISLKYNQFYFIKIIPINQ